LCLKRYFIFICERKSLFKGGDLSNYIPYPDSSILSEGEIFTISWGRKNSLGGVEKYVFFYPKEIIKGNR